MTAKTIPLKAALSEASKLCGDAVQAQNGFISSWGVAFRSYGIYFGTISILAMFCLLTVNLSEFE